MEKTAVCSQCNYMHSETAICKCGKLASVASDCSTATCPECVEWQQSFDLYHDAQQRGIKAWQEATGQHHVWPDSANLMTWLLTRLSAAECVIDAARQIGKIEINDSKLTNLEATAINVALHVKAYDQQYGQ